MSSFKRELTGAGFVIFFNNLDGIVSKMPHDILYLVLLDNNNLNDFPKGGIDHFEESFECAKRETFEETSLEYLVHYVTQKESKIFSNGLKMYIAEYILNADELNAEIDLNKNIDLLANNKFKEHQNFSWLTFQNSLDNFPMYLKEVLIWANKKIKP